MTLLERIQPKPEPKDTRPEWLKRAQDRRLPVKVDYSGNKAA